MATALFLLSWDFLDTRRVPAADCTLNSSSASFLACSLSASRLGISPSSCSQVLVKDVVSGTMVD